MPAPHSSVAVPATRIPSSAAEPRPPGATAVDPLDSSSLLRGTREVLIRHRGAVYRLRHTRNDKLILTK